MARRRIVVRAAAALVALAALAAVVAAARPAGDAGPREDARVVAAGDGGAAAGEEGAAPGDEGAPAGDGTTAPADEATEPPAADVRLPRAPRAMAAAIESTTDRLHAAVDRWRGGGEPRRRAVPEEVELLALHQQRIVRRLVERRRLFERVLPGLSPRRRAEIRDLVLARRELASIHSVVVQRPKVRIGPAQPPARLLAHYRRAWRRFGVGRPLLAAVNHVETAFGRLRNESVSGARGPMQFMPATWAAYGLGGDVRDPRDAILGAANYLRANGAPGDEARALYRYNPSAHYVSAVRRIARRIRADERMFHALYAWQVHYRGRWRTAPGA